MRRFRWDADPVSRGNLLAKASLNRAVAFLVWCDGLSVDHCATDEKRGGNGLHIDHVHLGLMPLGLAVRPAMNQKDGLVGEIPQLPNGENGGDRMPPVPRGRE